jgi:hypothetical protein
MPSAYVVVPQRLPQLYMKLSSGELFRFFRAIWRDFGALQFFWREVDEGE